MEGRWEYTDILVHEQLTKNFATDELYRKIVDYRYGCVHNIPHQENPGNTVPLKGLKVFSRHHTSPYHQC